MRILLALLAAPWLGACGGSPQAPPIKEATPERPAAGTKLEAATPDRLVAGPRLVATIPIPPGDGAFGPAFSPDGASVLFAVGDRLHRFDPRTLAEVEVRPTGTVPHLGAAAVVLHGVEGTDAAFDLAAM